MSQTSPHVAPAGPAAGPERIPGRLAPDTAQVRPGLGPVGAAGLAAC
jgi:hypothetical protein